MATALLLGAGPCPLGAQLSQRPRSGLQCSTLAAAGPRPALAAAAGSPLASPLAGTAFPARQPALPVRRLARQPSAPQQRAADRGRLQVVSSGGGGGLGHGSGGGGRTVSFAWSQRLHSIAGAAGLVHCCWDAHARAAARVAAPSSTSLAALCPRIPAARHAGPEAAGGHGGDLHDADCDHPLLQRLCASLLARPGALCRDGAGA